jgi:hypothetical protein
MLPSAGSNTEPNKCVDHQLQVSLPKPPYQSNEVWKPEITGTVQQMTDIDSGDRQQET